MTINNDKIRCGWCNKSELYQRYHDEEWGVPVHDDSKHFEMLLLETMQAGLSWYTILQRREGYRRTFANFDPTRVAEFTQADVLKLMTNREIIRNQRKIEAAISNARQFLLLQKEFGSFDAYIWSFTKQKPIINQWVDLAQVPANSNLSDIVARDLKQRGFKFVGSTTIYAHLQAIGVIDDHLLSCWRRAG